jgi:hypothetical protein
MDGHILPYPDGPIAALRAFDSAEAKSKVSEVEEVVVTIAIPLQSTPLVTSYQILTSTNI